MGLLDDAIREHLELKRLRGADPEEVARQEDEALEIEHLTDPEADPLKVTASFGVATLPGSASDVGGLIEAADDALYEAKRSGKNRTVRAGSGVRGRRGVHGVASTE